MNKLQVIGFYIFIKGNVLLITNILFDSSIWIGMIFGMVSVVGISIMYFGADG